MRAALIPASTSRAAPLISRLRSNCSVTPVVPRVLEEVISVMPAMCPNCRSRGVAIEEAIMSGLAPGKEAATVMVGKSTCGSGDTGSTTNAMVPAMATATVSSVVATGRSIKMRDGFMPGSLSGAGARTAHPDCRRRCRSPVWCIGSGLG